MAPDPIDRDARVTKPAWRRRHDVLSRVQSQIIVTDLYTSESSITEQRDELSRVELAFIRGVISIILLSKNDVSDRSEESPNVGVLRIEDAARREVGVSLLEQDR